MIELLSSDLVHGEIDDLLLSGKAATAYQAEEMFLDDHLAELAELIRELEDGDFQSHEAIKLLMSHGSRRREDAV